MEINKKRKLRTKAFALAGLVLMGTGITEAKAAVIEGADGGPLKAYNEEETDTISEIENNNNNDNALIFPRDEIWDGGSLDVYMEAVQPFLCILSIDGVEYSVIYCRAPELGTDRSIYRDYISYWPIFEIKEIDGKEVYVGLGPLEGKNVERVKDFGLEQYFDEVLGVKLEWPETMGELKAYIESIPELAEDYLVLPLNLEELMGNKENSECVNLVYVPDGYMKFDEEAGTLETYARVRRS